MKALYISGFNVVYDRSGNNSLSGINGATNLIIGGRGDDYLEGGRSIFQGWYNPYITSNNTYQFSIGDGKDIINNYDDVNSHENDIDVIKFTDVNSDEVSYRGENYDLIIEYGNNDSIRVLNFFKGNQYWINEIHFADKVVTHADLFKIDIPVVITENGVDFGWSGSLSITDGEMPQIQSSPVVSYADSQVQQMTSAMASFGVSATATDINSSSDSSYLGTLLVANN
ncbi:calcium-binding protein [Pseudomonas sp. F1_0610]|uniref:calcium-binding protein n=1 Tax=Pseudomonas sp. F1_0610 TaxID=3114284 RepID=UPI0039C30B54